MQVRNKAAERAIHHRLKQTVSELQKFIDETEQKTSDISIEMSKTPISKKFHYIACFAQFITIYFVIAFTKPSFAHL